jgi:hypothetical protein
MAMVFDTGPLIALACSDAELLGAVGEMVGPQASWAEAVRDEIIDQARYQFPCARQVLRAGWLGAPVPLNEPDDLVTVEQIRQVFVRAGDGPRKHVGEAASILLAAKLNASIVLDDRDAYAHAKEVYSLTVHRSLDLLSQLLEAGTLACDRGWEMYNRMRRVSRLPDLDRSAMCPTRCSRHR